MIDQDFRPDQPKSRQVTGLTWAGNSVSCTYDNGARLTGITRSNSTTSTLGYDVNNRLTTLDHRTGASSFAMLQYTVNAADQTVALDSSHSLTHPVLTSDIGASFTTANQLFSRDGQPYISDNDGNLLSGDSFSGGSYDLENRLLQISKNGTSYVNTYDGKGHRALGTSGGQTTRYYYDLDGRLLFESIASTVTARYFFLGNRLAAMERNGSHFFYHFDRNGNTLALSDSNGAVVTRYAYEMNGLKTTSGADIDNSFTYVGGYGVIDEGNGLYHMGKRHYDADLGRFMQKDPLGFAGGSNLYAYAGNNPVDAIDPEGELLGWILAGVIVVGYVKWHRATAKTKADVKAKQKKNIKNDDLAAQLATRNKNIIKWIKPVAEKGAGLATDAY